MRFAERLDATVNDPLLRAETDDLLAIKQRAGEAHYGMPMPRMHAFIAAELARGKTPPVLPASEKAQANLLDRLRFQTVMA